MPEPSVERTIVATSKYDPRNKPIIAQSADARLDIFNGTAAAPEFDPEKHLNFEGRVGEIVTMEEIGYPMDRGVCNFAASRPFPLFTKEAIEIMRAESLNERVLSNYMVSSSIAACQVRGFAQDVAPFTWAAWTHPETAKCLSQVIGIPVQVGIDYEVCHVNIAAEMTGGVEKLNTQAANESVVGWHHDSFQFALVVMLSDTTELRGGETAIKSQSGEIIKVEDPRQGSATLIQGRYLEHIALKSTNMKERITMVASVVPKNHLLKDEAVLSTLKPISENNRLFTEWVNFRMERMLARAKHLQNTVNEAYKNGEKFPLDYVTEFSKEQESYWKNTYQELHLGLPPSL